MAYTSFYHDSDAVLDYNFDWGSWLASGETISSHTITAEDGITVDSSAVDTDTLGVTVWLSGGTVQEEYLVTCHIVTSEGREDDRTMKIKVRNR